MKQHSQTILLSKPDIFHGGSEFSTRKKLN